MNQDKNRDYIIEKYPNSYEDVFNATILAISDCDFVKDSADISSGIIFASAKASIWSWGEIIDIYVSEKENRTEISISSTPKLQLIDWGKSSENVEFLFSAIKRRL